MELLFEQRSRHGLEETIENLKSELGKKGFGVLWELNFKDKLKEKGFDYGYHYWVLEVCNPSKAYQVLQITQKIGYFLPCKLVVYESVDGIKVGMAKPSQLIELIDSNDALMTLAKEVEETLTVVISNTI